MWSEIAMFLFPSFVAFLYFLTVFMIWAGSEIYLIKTITTKQESVTKESVRNNQILIGGTVVVMVLMVSLFILNSFVSTFMMIQSSWISIIGTTIALIGIYMRKKAILTLKENFDVLVQIKEEQKLIESGLYKYFRHPSYTASLITYFGFGMGSLNVINLVVLPLFLCLVYMQRIEIKEKVLIKGFGTSYVEYKNRTWGLLPIGLRKNNKSKINKKV